VLLPLERTIAAFTSLREFRRRSRKQYIVLIEFVVASPNSPLLPSLFSPRLSESEPEFCSPAILSEGETALLKGSSPSLALGLCVLLLPLAVWSSLVDERGVLVLSRLQLLEID
jgi:hypothetical protein